MILKNSTGLPTGLKTGLKTGLTTLALLLAPTCLLGGCTASGPGAGSRGARAPRAVQGIEVSERDVALPGPASETYGKGAVTHELLPVEQALLAKLEKAGGKHDLRLSKVARVLALHAPDRLTIPASLVEGLLSWAGLTGPSPKVVSLEIPAGAGDCVADKNAGSCPDGVASLIQEATRVHDPEWSTLGAGVAKRPDGSTLLVALMGLHAIDLEPVAVNHERGASVELRGRLLGGRTQPRVDVIDPKGAWTSLPTETQGDGFTASVKCERKGRYQIEVFGDGRHGPEVVANFPVYCSAPVPDTIHMVIERVSPDTSIADLERAGLDYINQTRAQRGLEPLVWDESIAELARAHSRDMFKTGFVGHRSPTTGEVDNRFEAAGRSYPVIRENIALGTGPRGIHEGLMRSPGHRVNIVADDVSHVGVGVVVGDPISAVANAPRPLYVTQNYYLAPGADTPENPVQSLRALVNDLRKDAGLSALSWDDKADVLAQILADGRASGKNDQAAKAFKAKLPTIQYSEVSQHMVVGGRFQSFLSLDLWREDLGDVVGLGVAPIKSGKQKDFLALVILVVKR
ncbi:MAG: CAP domain-containing protein [Nannocystaceae bacterium]